MKRIHFYILIGVLLTINSSRLTAQSWLQRYGNDSDNTSAQAMEKTADGGYFFCGSSDNSSRLFLVKTDAEGGVLMTQKHDFGQTIEGNIKMVASNDDTYWLTFATTSSATNIENIRLVHVSQTGKILSKHNFGDVNDERVGGITRLADGNLLISITKKTLAGDSAAILKTDNIGGLIFYKTIPLTNRNATQIVESQNRSSIYLASRGDLGRDTARILKLDANGGNPSSILVKPFGTNESLRLNRIDEMMVLPNGKLAVLGDYFAQIDTLGAVEWYHPRRFYTYPNTFTRTQDGGFAIVGSFDSLNVQRSLFIKVNGAGVETYSRIFDVSFTANSVTRLPNKLVQNADESFVLAEDEVNLASSQALLMKISKTGAVATNEIKGRVFIDRNFNNQLDGSELGFQNLIVEAVSRETPSKMFRSTPLDSLGNYVITVDSGSFDLRLQGYPSSWNVVNEVVSFSMDDQYGKMPRNLSLQPIRSCSQLEVNVTTGFLRRCTPTKYRVRYANNGAGIAQNAYVTIQLDSLLNFQTATLPVASRTGRTLRFNLGNVQIGKTGSFDMTIAPACGDSLKEGQTLCVEAHIFPDSSCVPAVNWSGANLTVTGNCETDSVAFRVTNTGTATNTEGKVGIVIVDDVIFSVRPAIGILPTNTTATFKYPKNGSTYRMNLPQVTNNPSLTTTQTVAIEGCRNTNQTNYSVNKVNAFPEADVDKFVDKECQILRGDFVGGEIEAFPQGYRDQHYINANDGIEYEIRFRNMGTDTAFTVQVRDTLADVVDPNSIELGASSHPYQFSMFGKNLLKFSFTGINLPSNSRDSVNSFGFVKFRVNLNTKNLPNGTKVLNRASVSFNYGAFASTNQVFHTIGQNFIISATVDNVTFPNMNVKIAPNPFSDRATFTIEGDPLSKTSHFTLYDMMGRQLRSEFFEGNQFEFDRQNVQNGIYVFKIENQGRRIATGKLVIKN
ncbi:MAG: T9SS type A sorting domain-containing protein [Saprospiraceae bacterium]|nr:T9SS type A sorting domain-containing protein [Saprospiraceae bacterium]